MSKRIALLALFAAVILPSVILRDYWDPDEGRYGAVAREVWRGDGALVPHLNGEVYGEKPPLFFWLVAAGQAATGSLAAPVSRIPSALSTLLAAFLLLALVRRTHGEEEGFLAAVIYLTSVLVFQMGSWVGIDALVTLLVVATVYAQVRAREDQARPGWQVLVYSLLAAIVLAKGAPVIIALVALAGYGLLDRGWRGLFPRHLLWGIPLFFLLLAAWALPAALSFDGGWDYLRGLTIGQAERRIAAAAASHDQPIWYYVTNFPALFFPWTLLVPAAVAAALREMRARGRARIETGRYVVWFVAAFVLFSLVKGKRERYILPLYPAAAALAGIAIVRLRRELSFRWLVRRPLLLGLLLLAVAGAGVAALPFCFDDLIRPRFSDLDPAQALLISERIHAALPIFLVGGLSVLVAAADGLFRRRDNAPVAPVAASVAFLVFTLGVTVLPALDHAKSWSRLVKPVAAAAGPAATYGLVDLGPGPFLLALDREDLVLVRGKGKRQRAATLLRERPEIVWFARLTDVEPIARKSGAEVEILARRQVGRRRIAAFRRR